MRVVSSGSFLAWVVSLTSILALVVYERWFVPSLGCFFDVVRFDKDAIISIKTEILLKI